MENWTIGIVAAVSLLTLVVPYALRFFGKSEPWSSIAARNALTTQDWIEAYAVGVSGLKLAELICFLELICSYSKVDWRRLRPNDCIGQFMYHRWCFDIEPIWEQISEEVLERCPNIAQAANSLFDASERIRLQELIELLKQPKREG
jgi:hypothetical protein